MEYRSTAGQIKDFITGPVWADMMQELNGSVRQLRDGLESAKDFETVLRFQECLDTIRRVMVMPEVILDDMGEIESDKGAAEAEEYKDKT